MRKPIAGAAGAVAIVAAAVPPCGTSAPTVVRAPEPKPTVTKTVTAKPSPASINTVKPKPAVARTPTQAPSPAAGTPTPAPTAATPSAAPAAGYLGDIFGGGAGNPCNFASGYQLGVCNPTGETEQQYIDNPGAPAP